MKVYVEKEKVYKAQELTEKRCDLCGCVVENPSIDDRWGHDGYNFDETQVHIKSGYSTPEGGSGTEINIDICPKCFTEKLIPWLKEQGVTVEETEWDF